MILLNKINVLWSGPVVDWLISRAISLRFQIIVLVHIILFGTAYLFAFSLLNETMPLYDSSHLFYRTLIPLILIKLGVFWYHDLYQGLWRYVSFQDLMNILRATTISYLIFIAFGIAFPFFRLPQTLYALDWVFCVMLVGGIRFSVREFREKCLPGTMDEKRPILMVGPIPAVFPLVKELLSDPLSTYIPCGIVDPTRTAGQGRRRLFDLPVWSLDQTLSAVRRNRRPPCAVVLCWPEGSKKQMDEVVEVLQPLAVPFKTVPRTEDIISDRIKISDIRDVEIDDLLDRPPIHTEMALIRANVTGKTILVSGGGGSIGSELCRQISAFEPACLVIAERSENSLYDLEIELRQRFPSLHLVATISSVNDYEGMKRLMERTGVDMVFHAAAYKHVPIMEGVPIESAYNNILGTHNLARAAVDTGVKRFVMVSTDKAVNPTNVMGVTKRIAEMTVQGRNGATANRFMVVRFGNVLGSAGSVVPLFKKQILSGGPITVTHPEIERFFMTIPEAVQLILQAGAMGRGGEIFVLEMGKPVKILRLAEKLITLSGKRPYKDIEIVFTGIRPGEKMYEELFNHAETVLPTSHPQIRMARCERVDMKSMEAQLERIRHLVSERDEVGLILIFKKLVPSYQNGKLRSGPPELSKKVNVVSLR
jgi:FlaA1/EpsC-like NDP-sugar epimerase